MPASFGCRLQVGSTFAGTSRVFGVALGVTLLLIFQLASATGASDWQKMRSITPETYICKRAPAPPTIDGRLDEQAWKSAPWTKVFLDIEGAAKPKPRFRTRAKMLWDDDYLYIAAELEEPHVWATLTNHDSVIFNDPDFEVFIDPRGETQPYYEFEINALNTTWDLRLNKPYMDGGKPNDAWEISGANTAVQIRGTLNNPSDKDRGWTVELAFPWKALTHDARHEGPPNEGERWRINFSRVEWQIVTTNGAYKKIPNTPEDNWVWSPQGVVDMHRPEMWGVVQFVKSVAGGENVGGRPELNSTSLADDHPSPSMPLFVRGIKKHSVGIIGKPARDTALEIYYAERDFWSAHKRWATNLAELNFSTGTLASPIIEPTADGYVCSVPVGDGKQQHVWRIRQDRLLRLDTPMPVETETFVMQAAEKFGDAGRRAAYFLVDNMPEADRATLGCDFLMENLSLAFEARKKFPWATNVAERMFFNDVLPYASLDEPRDPWRAEFFKLASEIVVGCTNASDAAQVLNRDLFKRINVHYNLGRKLNNQSPKESIEQHKATCTGLSIILVDACRAVGIPARVVGVPEWAHKDGNHTWVEIWDGDWFFCGADEYDKNGLNRGWFNGDAAKTARSTNALNQIYASSWRRTDDYFPLAWDLDLRDVAAVNVSPRYAALEASTNVTATVVHLRLRETENGERLPAVVELRSAAGALLATNYTRAGTSDMNDMPDFVLPENATSVTFRFVREVPADGREGSPLPAANGGRPPARTEWRALPGEAREKQIPCAVCMKSHTLDFAWNELKPVSPEILAAEAWLAKPETERGAVPEINFSRDEAQRLISLTWENVREQCAASAKEELSAKKIVLGEHSLKWLERTFGDAPDGKHSLWITMHGGGQGTEEENDRNWRGYYGRYEFPPGSINVAPRVPANTWDMWHVKWTDDLFDRLISDYVLQRGVDPNRVYLIGYSAGGDGVYQLSPRLSDRFAAAAMCAGHPNEITPEGLRNLPFFLYMGGDDSAYNRNVVVREFSAKMDALQKNDPDGYVHRLTVFPGLPHNMQNRESEMIPRMTVLRRNVWPKRVVWEQDDDAVHTRLYWLARDAKDVRPSEIFAAHVEGQTITIETPDHGSLTLRLSDSLLDLDKPVRVVAGGSTIFEGQVKRSFTAVVQSLREREDPETVATALLPVSW